MWDWTCTERLVSRERGDATQMLKQWPTQRPTRRPICTLTWRGGVLNLTTPSRILVVSKEDMDTAKMTFYKERVFRSAATQWCLCANKAHTTPWRTPAQRRGFLILSTATESSITSKVYQQRGETNIHFYCHIFGFLKVGFESLFRHFFSITVFD